MSISSPPTPDLCLCRSLNLFSSVARNSLVGYMLEGSSFKQAVDTGRKGGNCSKVYYKCPVNKDSLASGIKSIISAAA